MRSWEDSNKEARLVKGEFRARVAELARKGRAVEALQENLRLMGIDWRPGGPRPKLVAVGDHRVDRPPSKK